MLPFLKPKRQDAGLIISQRKPDGGKEELHAEGDELHALEACAEDLLRGINSKDPKAIAQALKNSHEICDSYPHEEAEHTNEEPQE